MKYWQRDLTERPEVKPPHFSNSKCCAIGRIPLSQFTLQEPFNFTTTHLLFSRDAQL